MNQKYGSLTSSTNPEEIASTVKGIILALSSVVIFFAATFLGITLTANDILSLATDVGMGAGAVWTIYGLLMKVVVRFAKQ